MKPLVFVLFLISGMLSAEDAVQYGDCEIKSDNDKMKLVCSAGLKNGIILSCNSDGHFSILLTTREISYTGLPEEWRDHPGIMVGQGFISVIIYIDNIRYIFEEQGYTFAMLWSYRAGSSFYVYNIFHGALLRSALISWLVLWRASHKISASC